MCPSGRVPARRPRARARTRRRGERATIPPPTARTTTMENRRVILCVDAAVAIGDDAARAKIRDALRDLDGADDVSRTTYDEIDDSVVAPREPPRDGFYVAVVDGEGATRAGAAAREALRAGGTCAVRVVDDGARGGGDDARDALVLAGFTDVGASEDGVVRGKKPDWARGTSFALKSREAKTPAKTTGWGDEGADDDLIDENTLLTELDVNSKPVKYDDCEIGAGKKACKNCTCGRAEAEAAEEEVKPETFVSACGNCALGDAFRCAGCPYLGQPAFKDQEGTKVELDLADDL